MRRLIAAALLLFCVCAISPANAAAPPTPTALDLAKRIDSHYNKLQSLKADFTEEFNGLGMHRSESGTMLLRKPGRMRWNYTSTPGKVFVLDGKYAWFYTPGVPQVQRLKASELDDLRSPLRFLLGHTKIESELEQLNLASSSAGTLTLSGVPRGQQKRITKVTITAGSDGAIRRLEIDETDGAQTIFDFSNEQTNPALPESEFHFNPPAGIPVVDALSPV
ncbi:outer membrane lipoprotein chaperone LolA [Acidicapsa dinghuensis]|uniref:Outer-membrane lipoprotein carrier protein n=1 Tax=Acidicapsa dinghuensis TaxID=2218256 RepID=A0ABW1EKY3_9BACT|nr:outer membrane lipoprotein chaperone LolA [Acidicapsa dinghuensis]